MKQKIMPQKKQKEKRIEDTKGRDKTGGQETKFTFGDTLGDTKKRKEPDGLRTDQARRRANQQKNLMAYDRKNKYGKKGYEPEKLLSPEDNDSID